jgi:hypothetical protein
MPVAQMDAPDGKPSGSYGEGEAKKSKGPILTHDSSSARRASSVPYQESRSAKHRTGSVLKGLPRGAACLVLTCAGPISLAGSIIALARILGLHRGAWLGLGRMARRHGVRI